MNNRYFQDTDTEEKAYWLGFLATDGNVKKTTGRVVLGLAEKDECHLKKLQSAVGSTGKINRYAPAKSVTINFGNREMAADLAQYHITPAKTWTVKPPVLRPDLMRHYWRGCVDGDGHISGREIGFIGNEAMVLGLKKFIKEQTGYDLTVYLYSHKRSVRIQTNWLAASKAIAHLLYDGATVYLDRKLTNAQELMQTESRYVDLSRLTAQELLSYKAEFGTWDAVAESLGTNKATLRKYRKQLSLTSILPVRESIGL